MQSESDDQLNEFYNKASEPYSHQYYSSLYDLIFAPITTSYPKFLDWTKLISSQLCASAIKHGDLSFKCMDCGRENEFHIICENCFKNGFHENHRFVFSCDRGGCCDCGDIGAIDEIGFCKFHKGYSYITNEIKMDINYQIRFFYMFESFFQKLFHDLEKKIIDNNEMEEENTIFIGFLEFFEDLINKFVSIGFVLSDFFMIKAANSKNNIYKHDCKNLEDLIFEENHVCECTYLELLMKFQLFFNSELQKKLELFIYKLFPNLEFKKHLVVCYSKLINFIYYLNEKSNPILIKNSEIRPIYTQFFSEKLIKIMFDTNFPEIFLKRFERYLFMMENKDFFESVYSSILSFYNLLYFFNERRPLFDEKLLKSDFFNRFLCLLSENRSLKYNDLILKHVGYGTHIFSLGINLISEFLGIISKDYNSFINKCQELLINMFEICLKNTEINNELNNLDFLQENDMRIMSLIFSYLIVYMKDLEKFKFFIKNIFSQEKRIFVFKRYFKNIFNNIRKKKKFTKLNNNDLIHNYKLLYNSQLTHFYEMDINLLQLILLIDGELILTDFFNNEISKENFDIIWLNVLNIQYSSMNLTFNFDFKKKKSFIELILILLTNEISILNTTPYLSFQENDLRIDVLKNLFSNLFIAYPKVTYQSLKKILLKTLLNKELEQKLEEKLPLFIDLNTETKELSIKNEFSHIYEPFYWSNLRELGSLYFDNLQNFGKGKESFFGSGSENLAFFQKEILKMLIKIKFYHFLFAILFAYKEKEIVQNSLKILFFMLTLNSNEKLILLKEIIEVFPNFVDNLKKRFNDESCEIFQNNLNYFLKFFEKEKSNFLKNTIIESEISNTKNNLTNKELKTKALKEKLLQDFNKQREVFLLKNSKELQEDSMIMKDLNSQKIEECSICHNNQNNSEIRVICGYLTIDNLNNYYYGNKENQLIDNKIIISTCGHSLHKNCLISSISHNDKDEFSFDFADLKYTCKICKFYCNLSIPLVETLMCTQKFKFSITKNYSPNVSAIIDHIKSFILIEGNLISLFSSESNLILGQSLTNEFLTKILIIYEDLIDLAGKKLFDILEFLSEKLFSGDYSVFLRKYDSLTRNIFYLTRIFCGSSDCPNEFIDKIKSEIIYGILDMEKFSYTFNLKENNQIFSRLFWQISIYLSPFDENYDLIISFICKIYLNRLIFLFAYFILGQTKIKTIIIFNLQDILFQKQIYGYLQPYLYHIFGLLNTIFFLNEEEIEYDRNDFEMQIKIFQKILPNIFNIDIELIDKFSDNWLNSLLNEISLDNLNILKEDIHRNQLIKFDIILPKNYLEFYQKYVRNKCIYCNWFPKKSGLSLYLCLICEKVMCSGQCDKIPDKELGNLYSHSKNKHCGVCVYSDLVSSKIIFIEGSILGFWNALYYDNLGQFIEKKETKWEKYLLSILNLNKIKELLMQREIPQFIRNKTNLINTDAL